MQRGTCRSCLAEVAWVVTSKGHRMPLDPEPCDDGNVVITGEVPPGHRDAGVPIVIALRKGEQPLSNQDRYMSHFATCRYAGQHRKKART